jgi:nicotinamide-nucleotide amidase
MHCTIITIGDELLIGQTVDTNSAWIGQTFNAIGIKIYERIAVGDIAAQIVKAIDTARSQSDIIVITGGLGPTKDDITKKTLRSYFNAGEVLHEPTLVRIKAIFEKRGRPLLAINETQALVPDNCTVLENERGTAPGMWFDVDGKVIVSLPGVPYEMKHLITNKVIPKLKERFTLPEIYHRNLLCVGIGESSIAQMLTNIEDSMPSNIQLAYLPDLGMVKLRLSAYGISDVAQKETLDNVYDEMKGIMQAYVFAEEDISLQEAVGRLFQAKGKTFAVAESCTGGYVGHLVTSIPGSSVYFKGSLVTYSYSMKEAILGVKKETLETQGAVSEACVHEMLEGLLRVSDADYGVAISGIAGPDGGTAAKPVGTVCFAVGSKNEIKTYTLQFFPSRMENIRASAMTALNLLRKAII